MTRARSPDELSAALGPVRSWMLGLSDGEQDECKAARNGGLSFVRWRRAEGGAARMERVAPREAGDWHARWPSASILPLDGGWGKQVPTI